ncbi:hypothetical protein LEP1GSC171_2708 [Leptospira santarosai str. HAI1380]|uniref:Uncharacterized protein n=2 Tax=Leptospira santarosai TaxID=28183 RepID=A0AB73LYF1_9LEPT|nr:hypothetical protein B2G51_13605 [Leptospira santarosai]EKO35220.1 hypothetical protein LEP1GSC179_2036 [Leptospira santarosai str. MOR084]EKR93410.1 hypothetical protein LEP1GSC163_1789 [Leptospira santarosai str. CBC379]EMO31588.1 hypothetical protein LEP1GSC175_0872 [Leptospira santarosai str. HAI821]EMP00736.1 hypothetical protein LEP1GSC171_2708 [Leptospira santarosai str. HAI1380]OLY63077.1 hypothetical protein BWD11_17095 [Leptospira santarosai serovar Grippotyphosa]ONF81551.1 hypot
MTGIGFLKYFEITYSFPTFTQLHIIVVLYDLTLTVSKTTSAISKILYLCLKCHFDHSEVF